MAAAGTAAISFPSSKSTSLQSKTFIASPDRVVFRKVSLQYRDVSISGTVVSIRSQVTTEVPAKVEKESKKQEEGVIVNKFKPKEPYC
ncbi:ferredoxin--NADP reductase, leaf-type isozyme, chloroplastic-like [Gastrolobium bilobum]|uniref:ferredoxin--NADP reductase, leaf-type isozyme, chloroplastic-like n=1 Tax=Gastrolobium bilobum TaxID=150636 RepID=UPI002AB2A0E5|nr:ferredoxin--NADP reductase, leaf-type isozyme, chloroplastic-like [Gastrolobium bilobum]